MSLAKLFHPRDEVLTIIYDRHVGGGVVASVAPNSVAAHPAWRSCLVDVAISGFWDASATPDEVTAIRQGISDQMAPLRNLTTGPLYAQYLNEVCDLHSISAT